MLPVKPSKGYLLFVPQPCLDGGDDTNQPAEPQERNNQIGAELYHGRHEPPLKQLAQAG